MKAQRYEITLCDEAPALGSGQRVVLAIVGTKWVRAKNEVGERSFSRLRRDVWDALAPRLITKGASK